MQQLKGRIIRKAMGGGGGGGGGRKQKKICSRENAEKKISCKRRIQKKYPKGKGIWASRIANIILKRA